MLIITMFILIITNLILQSSVFPFLNFLVYLPNPALVSVVIISLFKGKYYGALFALSMGLLQDLMFGDVIGINALIYFLIAYAIGMINASLNNENTIIHIFFTSISTIFYNFMYFLFMYFLSRNVTLMGAVKRIFSLEILYNCILAIILYKILYKAFGVSSLKFGNRKR